MPHLHVCMFCFVVYSAYNDRGQEYLEVQLSKQSAEFTICIICLAPESSFLISRNLRATTILGFFAHDCWTEL